MHAKLLQSCLTLCDPTDCSPPGLSVHGILQARILEWVATPRDFSHPGFKPVSPALQADSLPSEPPGKGRRYLKADKETKAQSVPDSDTLLPGTPRALALPVLTRGSSPSRLSVGTHSEAPMLILRISHSLTFICPPQAHSLSLLPWDSCPVF